MSYKPYKATCLNCGGKYEICRSCVDINSWRQVTCSPECFREYIEKIEAKNKNADYTEKTEEAKEDNIEEKNEIKFEQAKPKVKKKRTN